MCPSNHGEVSAGLLRPYISPKNHWILLHHDIFQAYYYADAMSERSTKPFFAAVLLAPARCFVLCCWLRLVVVAPTPSRPHAHQITMPSQRSHHRTFTTVAPSQALHQCRVA
jgi:hypothetical protein